MVGETAVLVKGEDEQRVLPLGRVAESLVDALYEGFALVDGGRRVEGLIRAALRVYPGELRELAGRGVGVELSKWLAWR